MGCLKFCYKLSPALRDENEDEATPHRLLYLGFLLLALASSISLFISNRFLVLRECDFLCLSSPVLLFAIYVFY